MGKSWTEKKYRCFVCEKWFTSAKQLQGHLEGRKHAKCLATLTPEQAKAAAFAQAEAAKPKPPPPPPPPVQILYRDEYYIAVNKPAGLIVHKSAFTPGEKDSLLDRLRAQFPDLAGVLRPCHRLDRRTSGVIVFALSAECSRRTTYMFTDKSALVVDGLQTKSQRQMRKLYVCIARGFMEGKSGTIDRPLSISRFEDRTRCGQGEKKSARTRWTKLAQAEIALAKSPNPKCNTIYDSARLSVLLVEPLSGRFHQIRRHLGHPSVSHPVVGDTQHGDPRLNRSLAFTLSQIHDHGQPSLVAAGEGPSNSLNSGSVVRNEDGESSHLHVDAPPTKVLRASDGDASITAVSEEPSSKTGEANKSGEVTFNIGGEHVTLAQEAELPEIRQQLHAYSFEFVHPMVGRTPSGKLVPIVSQWVSGKDGQTRSGNLVSESSRSGEDMGGPLEPVRVRIVAPLQADMETLLHDVGIDSASLDFEPHENADQGQ